MLKQRVLTALVLLGAFLSALFWLPPGGWMVLSITIVAIGAWEWSGLCAMPPGGRLLYVTVTTVALAFLTYHWDLPVTSQAYPLGMLAMLAAGSLFWLLLVPLWLARKWTIGKVWPGLLVGWVVLLPAGVAFIQLRGDGAAVLLAAMALAWVADIAAYFVGRAIGKRKLAPTISPGKSWEGAIGGALGVVIYGLLVMRGLPQVQMQWDLVGVAMAAAALLLLAAVSVEGDLFESLAKRQAGLKDSGALLPGHGGLLDRIDSLTSTLPMVALLMFALK